MRDRIVATYDYVDASGHLLYQAVRKEPKSFSQRRPDGRGGWIWKLDGVPRVIYRLPQLLAADKSAWVFVVEGEKDADKLWGLGFVATTNAQGAGKWLPDYNQWLAGRRICILPDNDDPGRKHATTVAYSVASVAAEVRVLALPDLPPKGDVSDWLAMGGTAERLQQLVEDAPTYSAALPRPEGSRPEHTAKPTTSTPRHTLGSPDDLVAQVKAYWSTLAIFEHFGWVKNGIEEERNGSTRILGHGGLIIQRDGLWYNHSEQVGGDSIDAWAHCIRRDRDRYFIEILEEMAGAAGIVVRQPEPAPLPEGAQVLDNGHVILKTTPTPEPQSLRPLPPCTPALCAELRQALNSPDGRELLCNLPSRSREVYVMALNVLLTQAPQLGGWTFDIATCDLGVLFGKSRMSAWRNLTALDRAGKVNYRHIATRTEVGDAPPMHVDLSPIVYELLDVTGVDDGKLLDVTRVNCREPSTDVTNLDPSSTSCNVYAQIEPHTCNVYAHYAGDGEFADASMRANPMTKGLHGRDVRPLNAGTMNTLDLVARGELAFTRRELADRLGMSPGSATGSTRICVELGLATVEKEGRSHVYVFFPDWRARLDARVPKMVSFLGSNRLKVGNVSDLIAEVERRIKQLGGDPKRFREDDPQSVRDLHTRRKKMLFARKELIDAMEAKDLANRPQATPVTSAASQQWVGTPRHRSVRHASTRNVPTRVSEGELIERRLALYAAAA